MCGRYSLFTEDENQEIMRIVKSLDNRYPGNNMKHGEIFLQTQHQSYVWKKVKLNRNLAHGDSHDLGQKVSS